MFKKILFCASVVAMMASCADDSWFAESGEDSADQQIVVQPENDLTFGYNSIITETDSLSAVRIPLNTNAPALVTCSEGIADLQCVKIDGKYYLQVAHPEKAKMGVDEVTVSVNGRSDLTKRFFFTVRNSIPKTRAGYNGEAFDEKRSRFADVFSFGQYLWKGATDEHPASPMLQPEVLYYGLVTETDSINLIDVDKVFKTTTVIDKVTGSSLEEHTKQYTINAGLSNIPIAKAAMATLSAEFSRSEKTVSKNYYEYLTETKSTYSAAAQLSVGMRAIPAHDPRWKLMITPELDKVLNCPGTDEYKYYEDNDSDICRLIEDYGSHLLTNCVLGTQASLQFRKKQDLTRNSMDWALKIAVRRDSIQKPTSQDEVAAANYIDSKRAQVSGGVSFSYDDYLEETEAEWHAKLIGGNANSKPSFENWEPTENPQNWVPVSYNSNKAAYAKLRAIYELCQDSTSTRCKLLKHVLEDVEKDGLCPFVRWMNKQYKVDLNPKDTEWVLAGIHVDVDGGENPSAKMLPRQDDRTKKIMYYPFTDLAFKKGKCLDTQIEEFGKAGRGSYHNWYYAMAMRDDFPGLEDFKLVDYEKEDEFAAMGYFSCMNDGAEDFGDHWGCRETKNYILMAKLLKSSNAKPITGFRLEAWRKKDKTGECKFVGVSGGTSPEVDRSRYEAYAFYWLGTPHGPGFKLEDIVSYVVDFENDLRPVYYLSCIHQPWYLFLSTTTRSFRQQDVPVVKSSNSSVTLEK